MRPVTREDPGQERGRPRQAFIIELPMERLPEPVGEADRHEIKDLLKGEG